MPRPGCFTPRKETQYPLYRRLGGPLGRSRRVLKISPPTGIQSPDCPARGKSLYQLQIFDAVSESKIKVSHNLQSKPSKLVFLVKEITVAVLMLVFIKLEMHHPQTPVISS
jgi:hypothetical protein